MSSFNPLVSIVIPVYNGSNYMKEAIESALAQTYSNIEIIVVNDGSTDNTESIALSYGDKIRYFSKENGGVATALNMAIENALGEYISWLSHDDLYYPHKIKTQIEKLSHYKLSERENTIIFSSFDTIFQKTGKKVKRNEFKEFRNKEDYIFKMLDVFFNSKLTGCTLLIPKNLFTSIGFFDTEQKTTQDYALWITFFKNGVKFLYLPYVLGTRRVHIEQDSISYSDLHFNEMESLYRWTFDLFKLDFKNMSFYKFNHFLDIAKKIELCSLYVYMLYMFSSDFNAENLEEQNFSKFDFYYVKYVFENREYSEVEKKHKIKTFIEKKSFNVLQISYRDLMGNKFNGYDLSLYLHEKNINSQNYVVLKESKSGYVHPFSNNEYLTENIIKSALFLEADILHLHLIHNTKFDINCLPIITKLKPTIITLHDPYFLGGHFIHSFDCEKYKEMCYDCPNLDKPLERVSDTSSFEFMQKNFVIQNSNISAIVASDWMKEKVESSPIWKGKKIYTLPFGINQSLFKPVNKTHAKSKLGISEDTFTIMFRAEKTNPYKGVRLIEKCFDVLEVDKKIAIIAIYDQGFVYNREKYKVLSYKWLNDDEQLAELYNASDLFLMPSAQEAFGLMAIEAMSCKVPVLSTKGTALESVINSPECGLAVDYDFETYKASLENLINNPDELDSRAEKSYIYAIEHYNKDIHVEKMIKIYEDVIKNFSIDSKWSKVLEQLIKYKTNKAMVVDKVIIADKIRVNWLPSMFGIFNSKDRLIIKLFFVKITIKMDKEKINKFAKLIPVRKWREQFREEFVEIYYI